MNHIYRVEYDLEKTSEGNSAKDKILGVEYPNETTNEYRIVSSIIEEWKYGLRTVIVYYDNGEEEEIFNINRIFKGVITIK